MASSTTKTQADFVADEKGIKDGSGNIVQSTGPMKKIIIHPKGPDDPLFHPVGINGKVWLIRKGVEAVVPESVLQVLYNATETHFLEKRSPDGDIFYEDRSNPRFTVEARG